MQKKKLIIITVLGLLIILAGVFFIRNNSSLTGGGQQVVEGEPVDVALDFYDSWLIAAQSPDTDPYTEELEKDPTLGKDLRDKLEAAKQSYGQENSVDPVLCQTATPPSILARVSHVLEDEAQIIVLVREEGFTGQSVATLTKLNEGWYISDIECSAGEFGEEREFTFDNDGYILNTPELGGIYIIFAEDGVFGSLAPLSFGPESMCMSDGQETVCDSNSFGEKTAAIVKGQMSESGVSVQKVEFVDEKDLSFEQ